MIFCCNRWTVAHAGVYAFAIPVLAKSPVMKLINENLMN